MNRDMLNKNFKIEDRNFLLDIEKLTNKYINLKEIRDAYYDELSEFKNELDIEEIQSELNYLHLFLLRKFDNFFFPIYLEIKNIVDLVDFNFVPLKNDLEQVGIEFNYLNICGTDIDSIKLSFDDNFDFFTFSFLTEEKLIVFDLNILIKKLDNLEFIINEHKEYLRNNKIKNVFYGDI